MINEVGNVNISYAQISTTYYRMIIIEERQKVPLSDEEVYICREEGECISVSPGCCGCWSGGTAVAINKDYFNYWSNRTLVDCEDKLCIQVISDHWTCSAKPRCIKGKCQLVG